MDKAWKANPWGRKESDKTEGLTLALLHLPKQQFHIVISLREMRIHSNAFMERQKIHNSQKVFLKKKLEDLYCFEDLIKCYSNLEPLY